MSFDDDNIFDNPLVIDFLSNGYEKFKSLSLHPDAVFTAGKIVEVNTKKAYYLLFKVLPPLSMREDYRFRAIAQFNRLTEYGEAFNTELLAVKSCKQTEQFFTEIWAQMQCANYPYDR